MKKLIKEDPVWYGDVELTRYDYDDKSIEILLMWKHPLIMICEILECEGTFLISTSVLKKTVDRYFNTTDEVLKFLFEDLKFPNACDGQLYYEVDRLLTKMSNFTINEQIC